MRRFVLALALVAPLSARADVAADVTALTAALEAAGCLFTAENGGAVAEAAGLDQNRLLAAVNELVKQNLVSVTADGEMKLETEACK